MLLGSAHQGTALLKGLKDASQQAKGVIAAVSEQANTAMGEAAQLATGTAAEHAKGALGEAAQLVTAVDKVKGALGTAVQLSTAAEQAKSVLGEAAQLANMGGPNLGAIQEIFAGGRSTDFATWILKRAFHFVATVTRIALTPPLAEG
jgi:hypothetical protein